MKITVIPTEVAYNEIKHNEHFKYCNQEYIKIDNYYVSEQVTVDCALKIDDGRLHKFTGHQKVEKINKENEDIILKNIEYGKVFCYNNNYYLRASGVYEGTVVVVNLQTGRETSLNEEALVKTMEAELIIKK